MSRSVVCTIVILALPLIAACESKQCVQMRDCCAAISSEEWVGDACGALITELHNPQACASVVDAIKVAATDRKATLPQVCQ